MKKILFLITELNLGGIETLLLRMTNWLVENDYKVHILSKGYGVLSEKFPEEVLIKYFEEYSIKNWVISEKNIDFSDDFLKVDVVHAFSSGANLLSLQILKIVNNKYFNGQKNVKYLAGAYHPFCYIFYNKILDFVFGKPYLTLNDENKLFMSYDVKTSHEKFYKTSFLNSFVLPLPIDVLKDRCFLLNPKKFKIVSIGRFTSFKTYNSFMIDVVYKLKEKYPELSYHLYGSGEEESRLKEKINFLNLQDRVFLHGNVEYSRISSVMSDAYCFVGVGTSAIEASSLGVPSIVPIITTDHMTHGYLYELPVGNCGENIPGKEKKIVLDMLIELFESPEEIYENKKLQSKEYVKKYEKNVIMRKYLTYLKENQLTKYKYLEGENFIKLYCYIKFFLEKHYILKYFKYLRIFILRKRVSKNISY